MSSKWSLKKISAFRQLKNVLRWESTAPLGCPVVPDVYMMTWGSSGLAGPWIQLEKELSVTGCRSSVIIEDVAGAAAFWNTCQQHQGPAVVEVEAEDWFRKFVTENK